MHESNQREKNRALVTLVEPISMTWAQVKAPEQMLGPAGASSLKCEFWFDMRVFGSHHRPGGSAKYKLKASWELIEVDFE